MKYLLTLYAEESGWQEVSPEAMRASMEPWSALDREMIEAGAHIAGEPLQPSATATTVKVGEDEERFVSDGPFAETKEQLGGFYLLECADLDEALEWAKKVPIGAGGSVEVRAVMDFSEFGYEAPSEAEARS